MPDFSRSLFLFFSFCKKYTEREILPQNIYRGEIYAFEPRRSRFPPTIATARALSRNLDIPFCRSVVPELPEIRFSKRAIWRDIARYRRARDDGNREFRINARVSRAILETGQNWKYLESIARISISFPIFFFFL